MTTDHTPTTEEVRDRWGKLPYLQAAFDTWLATVKAQTLRDTADAMDSDPHIRDPLRLRSDWLRDLADRLDPNKEFQ